MILTLKGNKKGETVYSSTVCVFISLKRDDASQGVYPDIMNYFLPSSTSVFTAYML